MMKLLRNLIVIFCLAGFLSACASYCQSPYCKSKDPSAHSVVKYSKIQRVVKYSK